MAKLWDLKKSKIIIKNIQNKSGNGEYKIFAAYGQSLTLPPGR